MIDHRIEDVFPISHAPARAPRLRAEKRINVATFYRWASRGCRGVRLETLQVGGTRCTSREALQRFFERLSDRSRGSFVGVSQAPTSATNARAAREAEAVVEELDRL